MKGGYAGRTYETIYGYTLPGAVSLANWAARTSNISEKAKQRLKIVDWLRFHGSNISLTARHFGLDRETVREWKKKFDQAGILGHRIASNEVKERRCLMPLSPQNFITPISNISKVEISRI